MLEFEELSDLWAYMRFLNVPRTDKAKVVEFLLVEDKHPYIPCRQCHGCWSPDDTCSQDISSQGIDLVKPHEQKLLSHRILL